MMKKYNHSFIAIGLIVCVFGPAVGIVTAQMWPHYGGSAGMTACAPDETALSPSTVPQMTKLWGIGCDDGYFSVFSRSPAVWNDRLYAVGAGGPLECYDAKTGAFKWSYGGTMTGWCPQPTVTSGGTVLYLQGDSTNYSLKAVNGMTGALIWTAPLQFNLGFNDTAVVCLDEDRNQVLMLENPFEPDSGKLYAVNLTTGQINWYMSKAVERIQFCRRLTSSGTERAAYHRHRSGRKLEPRTDRCHRSADTSAGRMLDAPAEDSDTQIVGMHCATTRWP